MRLAASSPWAPGVIELGSVEHDALLRHCHRAALEASATPATDAAAWLERVIPNPGRRETLGFVARSIRRADAVVPGADHLFALRRERDTSFALYVGSHHVLALWRGGFFVYMDRATLGEAAFDALKQDGRSAEVTGPKAIAQAVGARFEYDEVAAWEPRIRAAHERFIENAATLQSSAHRAKADPALLAALRTPRTA